MISKTINKMEMISLIYNETRVEFRISAWCKEKIAFRTSVLIVGMVAL